MASPLLKFRVYYIAVFSTVLLFLALAIGSSLTNRPQIDEGMFASPAYNLATRGFFGTTVLEIEGSPLTRINERTYWVMPLFLLNVSASFKAFGMSLLTMRLVSVFWGLILLAAWYFIVLKLSGNRNIALVCLFLLACNYTVLDTASMGRMDIMSASLGFSALAIYLGLRERSLIWAMFLSQCFVVASGLTHPNGLFGFFGLLFTIIYLDFRQIKLKHIAVALVPYLVGGTAFGLWVLQDVEAFRAQFVDNAVMSGRMKGASSPLSGIVREFTEKYPHAYGLGANSGGHSGPIYLKSLILIGYIVGVLGALFTKSIRQNRNYFLLLILTAIYFVVMSLIDGQKQTPYLIHIVPFYCALLAIWLEWVWRKRFFPRSLTVLVIGFLVAVSAGGMAFRIKQNTYGNFYQPTIDFLKLNTSEQEMIMASSDFGFGLKFSDNLVDDGRFAFYTGKRPKFIVYDSGVELSWRESKEFFPEFYEYLPRLLQEEYRVAYENEAYTVYVRKDFEPQFISELLRE